MSSDSNTTPETPPKRHRGRWLLWGLLGLLGLVLVLVAGALIYLTSPAGEERVRARLVELANEQLSGRVEVGGVDLGLRSAVLEDVKLYDPEGELVAEVERVEAQLSSLRSLLKRHVDLRSVRLEQPHLYLRQDERGLNLTRALEPREPKPEEPDQPRGNLRLTLRDFLLENGSVDYVAETEDGQREVRLDDLDAKGQATWSAANQGLDVKLDATGSLGDPVEGPVRLSLQAQGEEGALSADVDLRGPGLDLKATGSLDGEKQARAEVKQLTLSPETARAVLPSYPIAVPLSLSGTVAQAGDTLTVDLRGQAAGGTAEVEGSLNTEQLRTEGLTARVQGIDLAELLGGGPHTTLVGELKVRGGGKSLETLDGQVDLTLQPSTIGGRPLGPVELHASAKDGRFELSQLDAKAPGASLTASGGGTLEDLRLKGRLVASDLSQFANTVGRLGDGQPLPLSGEGALDFTVSGPVRKPALTLSGGFDALAYGDTSVEGLKLDAKVPDVTQPLSTDATLEASKLVAGGRTFEDVDASLVTRGRALEATVRTGGPTDLLVALSGTVDKGGQGLSLDALTLRYPEATWTLQHPPGQPVHLGFGGGRLQVSPLTLTSGQQALTLSLTKEGERLTARTELRQFDLGRLPQAFIPPTLDVDGRLSGHVAVSGTLPRPNATVDLELKDGRFQQYAHLDLDLEGRYVRDRVTGTFSASAPAGRISADFNVPVEGLMERRRVPVSLELVLEQVDLGPALRMAGQPEAATGTLSGTLTLKGLASDPRLDLALQGSRLRYWGTSPLRPPPVVIPPGALPEELSYDPLGFELTARSGEKDGALTARLDLQGLGTQAYAVLQTPFSLGRLLSNPPSAMQVLETPVKLEAQVREAPLGLLSRMGVARRAGGTVSVMADLSGPLLAPVGKVDVLANKVTVDGLEPVDGNLALLAGDSETRFQLAARRGDALLAKADATLEAPLAALQDQEVVGRVPFSLELRAGPIPLSQLPGVGDALATRSQAIRGERCGRLPADTQEQPGTRDTRNLLSLDMRARGTLDDPTVDLTAGLQQLGVRQLALGQARVHYTYDEALSTLDALLSSPNGGSLLVRGKAPRELSLPALRQGVDFARVPLEADVQASRFDMAFLSNSLPLVRSIAGELQANGQVAGTFGAPTFNGTLQWKEGQLALEGFGEYRKVQVELGVTDQRFELKQLSARSGNGSLRFTAQGDRTPAGPFSLSGEGELSDFPLVYNDQLLALLSLRTSLEGEVSPQLVNLRNLTIPEARITLPEARSKDLQALDRPEGIVLLCDGVPLEKRKRKKAPNGNGKPPDTATGGGGLQGEPEEPQRQYWVNVNAPRNLWVSGADVNAELGLSENFRIEYADETAIYGEVRVLRGQVEVLGRKFEVQRSSQVRFSGPARTPYINATAEHVNERAGVKVFVTVRGQGKDFTLKPTSEPPLPETEIYTLLATGRRTLKAGSGESMTGEQTVSSILGSVLASQARKALAQKLPLDVFSIEAGDEGLSDARLEVGKYLNDNLYLGYSGRLGASPNVGTERENNNAVRLEYQFGPRWGFEVEYGDAQQGGADVIWSKEY